MTKPNILKVDLSHVPVTYKNNFSNFDEVSLMVRMQQTMMPGTNTSLFKHVCDKIANKLNVPNNVRKNDTYPSHNFYLLPYFASPEAIVIDRTDTVKVEGKEFPSAKIYSATVEENYNPAVHNNKFDVFQFYSKHNQVYVSFEDHDGTPNIIVEHKQQKKVKSPITDSHFLLGGKTVNFIDYKLSFYDPANPTNHFSVEVKMQVVPEKFYQNKTEYKKHLEAAKAQDKDLKLGYNQTPSLKSLPKGKKTAMIQEKSGGWLS